MGTGTDTLRMDYVSGSAEIQTGDTVVTSGIDGIYPKGFVIGRVEKVERSGGHTVPSACDRPWTSRCWRKCWSCSRRRCRKARGRLGRCGEVVRGAAALVLALVLQTTLAQVVVRGTGAVDLVLVVVIYIAISSGANTGLLAGAAAGLAQDALSSGSWVSADWQRR